MLSEKGVGGVAPLAVDVRCAPRAKIALIRLRSHRADLRRPKCAEHLVDAAPNRRHQHAAIVHASCFR